MARRSASVLALLLCLVLAASGGGQKQHHRSGGSSRPPSVPQLLPAHGAANRHARGRCRGTKLRWCGPFHHQKPQPARLAPAFSKPCPGSCSGVGVCNALSGLCDCPAGWTGADCSEPLKRPCSAGGSGYRGPGTQPMSHIGPDGRDLNWTEGWWTASRCGGICDDERAMCYCDDPKNGRQPAPPDSPPGTPPVRQGRPLPEGCQPREDKHGNAVSWGQVPYDALFGPKGWCRVPVGTEPEHRCGCHTDGVDGGWCELVTEQFCVNSCSGHGTCDAGFCKCEKGWFGHDCAGRVQGQQPDESDDDVAALHERPWLKDGALVPPAGATRPAKGATRKRPFIFVYDSPAFAAARMLQYRSPKSTCVWRHWDQDNKTVINGGWTYPLETLLHEMLLQSRHRTLDPDEADFFFVPSYTSCFMWPIHGWADFPWWYSDGGPRVMHMANMLLELKSHIQQAYPYWNRTQGRDHIWLATHDEGACWFPKEIYDNSIILTHWGRLDADHESNTAYTGDNYSQPHLDAGRPGGNVDWTEAIKGHRCYTPGKDLVVPLPKFPAHYRWSPLLGAPAQKRTTLLYFRGDVGKHRLPHYSRGIRQALYNLSKTHDWEAQYGVRIGDRDDVPGEYSLGLASSKFALVAPGDGWSPRAEDAILHGCIPVVIMDWVHAPLESLLDWDAFSVRVAEEQLVFLPHILLAIPPDRLARMQANLRKVWHRFAYLSQPLIRADAEEVRAHWQRERQLPESQAGQQPGEDEWDAELEALDEEWQEAQEAMHERQAGLYLRANANASSSSSKGGAGGGAAAPAAANVTKAAAAAGKAGGGESAPAGGKKDAAGQKAPKPAAASRGKAAADKAAAGAGTRRRSLLADGASALQGSPLAEGRSFQNWTFSEGDAEDDAFGTLMQWLYAKLLRRHGVSLQHDD